MDLSVLSPGTADTGFSLTMADALAYARFLAGEAHARGLSAGIGGADDIAAELVSSFEWALTQGCLAAGTCGAYAAFVAAKEVVFAVEFGTAADSGDRLSVGPPGGLGRADQEPVARRVSDRLSLTRPVTKIA